MLLRRKIWIQISLLCTIYFEPRPWPLMQVDLLYKEELILLGRKGTAVIDMVICFLVTRFFLLPRSVRGGLCLCFSLIRLGIALVNERPISRPDSDNSLKILLRWWMINKWSGTLQYIRNKRMDLWEFNYIYKFDFIQYIWRKIYCFVL